MRVSICGLSFRLTEAIVRHVEDRVEAALGSASARISQVTVRLDDINGPRGGADKRCRIVVCLRGLGYAIAGAQDQNLYAAVGQAAAKAKKAVTRHLTGQRSIHRSYLHCHSSKLCA